ncbi:MAG: cation:proton antiporter [Tepidisphaeraceae bacterium]
MHFPSVSALLLVQLTVILAVSRAMGWVARLIRQPQVIGEIVAGLVLGPSLLGWVWPGAYAALFAEPASLQGLNLLAQLGVLLFLFLVGLEFDADAIRPHALSAGAISVSGMLFPFVLGFGVAFPLRHLFEPIAGHGFLPSALFMGVAMSVTAFPVLARIISEWKLQQTIEGRLSLAAAAVGDVIAWMLLALVVAFASQDDHGPRPLTIAGLTVAFVLVMLVVVKPLLKLVQDHLHREGERTGGMAFLLLVAILSGFVTEMIGVHALFGAFVAGLVMPKHDRFVRNVSLRMESVVVTLLLPPFFVYAGLKVDLRQLLHADMIGYTVLLTAIACVGKIAGAGLAARLTGIGTRPSMMIGVLMNTRGLMELIILTVGLQLGVINHVVYGMMVVMALATTAMTAPVIHLLVSRSAEVDVPEVVSTPSPREQK